MNHPRITLRNGMSRALAAWPCPIYRHVSKPFAGLDTKAGAQGDPEGDATG